MTASQKKTANSSASSSTISNLRLILLTCAVLALSACVPPPIRDLFGGSMARTAELNETLARFHKQIYWGDIEVAAQDVAPEYRSEFITNSLVNQRGIKMVDVEPGKIDMKDGARRAYVEVKYRFYRTPNYVVEKRIDRQTWRYEYVSSQWYLEAAEQLGEALPNNDDAFVVGPAK